MKTSDPLTPVNTTRRDFITLLGSFIALPLSLGILKKPYHTPHAIGAQSPEPPSLPPDLTISRTYFDEDDSWFAQPRYPVIDSDHPDVCILLDAIHAEAPVRFQYLGGSTPNDTRTVVPAAIFTVGSPQGPIYFSAYCFRRHANRTFRLDRTRHITSSTLA